MTAAASDINDARIKRHTATWAPDDHRPRKGPHRLARSSTRRRLYAEVAGGIVVTAIARISVVMPSQRRSVRLEYGDSRAIFTTSPPTRIYGPLGDAWCFDVGQYGGDTVIGCPTRYGPRYPRQQRHLP